MIELSEEALAAAAQEWMQIHPGAHRPVELLNVIRCVVIALEHDGYIVEKKEQQDD